MSKRAGIDLNTVQIVASMGAAVTGAILTSYLGDGGTIVGTAVGAGTSTAGFAVYKHYLGRTKEKVTPVIAGHARQWSPTTQASSRRAAAAEQTQARTTASPDRAVPSDGRTRPDLGQPGPWQADAGQPDRRGRTPAPLAPARPAPAGSRVRRPGRPARRTPAAGTAVPATRRRARRRHRDDAV